MKLQHPLGLLNGGDWIEPLSKEVFKLLIMLS